MVADYARSRFALGAGVPTVSAELAAPHRMKEMGYTRPPGPTMLSTHVAKHMGAVAPVSANMPSFSSPTPKPTLSVLPESSDVASAIQQQALDMLQRGELRLTASHALRAQEILDRRSEKAKDREMLVALARVLTMNAQAPAKYIGGDHDRSGIIEGEAVEGLACG